MFHPLHAQRFSMPAFLAALSGACGSNRDVQWPCVTAQYIEGHG